jgi:hypothetical protein
MTNIKNRLFGLELDFSLAGTGLSYRDFPQFFIDAGINGVPCGPDGTTGVDLEIAFPPLPYNQFSIDYIKSVIELTQRKGATVNRSCGMHVHIGNAKIKDDINLVTFAGQCIQSMQRHGNIDALKLECLEEPMDAIAVKDIMERYQLNQISINGFFPPSRTNHNMCKPITRTIVGDTIEQLIANAMGKYCVINLQPWTSKGTIEFRQASGTIELDKITHWVEFLLTLVAQTVDNRIETGSAPVTFTTPETAPFRRGTRVGVVYELARQRGGVSTRELMDATGGTDGDIRRQFSEIRTRLESQGFDRTRAVIQHDQATFGNRYGDGTDLNGYEIARSYETISTGAQLLPDNRIGSASIWASVSDPVFEWFQNRIIDLRSR